MSLHVQLLWPILSLVVVSQTGLSLANAVVPGLSYLPPSPGKPKPTLIEVGTPAISVPGVPPSLGMLLPAFDIPGDGSSAAAGGASQPPIGTMTDFLPTKSCTKTCPFDYTPVCGSDGITYTNDCTFSVAACKNSNLVLEGVGPCGSPAVPVFPDSPPPPPPPPPPSPSRLPVVIPFPSDAPTFQTSPGSGVIPFPPSLASLGTTSEQGVPEDSLPLVKPASGCSEACTKIYIPLCGSDGITYNNKCLLEVAACKGRARGLGISVAHEGTCESLSVDVGASLGEVVDVRGASSQSSVSCNKQCTRIFDPVCGTDGKTYNSLCLLEIATCESVTFNNIPVSVDYKGSCAPNVGSNEGAPVAVPERISGNQQDALSVSSHGSTCPEACTKIYSPVCGSDDQTYNNDCILEVAACKSRSAGGAELFKAFDGPCVAALPRGPECNEMCDKTFLPICGSNGETYNNLCLLNVADCLNPFTTITLAKEGPCETTSAAGLSTDPRPAISTDPSQSAIDSFNAATGSVDEGPLLEHPVHIHDSSLPGDTSADLSSCNKPCTKILDPVCGTDDNTYNNPCLLEIASCESAVSNNLPITNKHKGRCAFPLESVGGTSVPVPDSIPTNEQDSGSVSIRGSSCPESCSRIYSPVCGSDDQTYNNECILEIAACKSRSAGGHELFKAFDGPCVAALPRGPACNEMCDKTFLPVCGSNGETYNNLCLLNVADCLTPFATITLASDGPCETSSTTGDNIGGDQSQSGVGSQGAGLQQEYLPPV